MILLREKQFTDDPQKLPKDMNEYRQELKKRGDSSYKAGVQEGINKERERIAEEAKGKSKEALKKKLRTIEEYTGIDSLKNWFEDKKDSAGRWARKNKEGIRKGFKYGAGGVLVAGGGVAAYKGYKHYKSKKKSEDLRKKVRGYDNPKKK